MDVARIGADAVVEAGGQARREVGEGEDDVFGGEPGAVGQREGRPARGPGGAMSTTCPERHVMPEPAAATSCRR